MKNKLIIFFSLFFFQACGNKSPLDVFINPVSNSAYTNGPWPDTWTLYDEELLTGGGVQTYTYDCPGQTIDFAYEGTGAYKGRRCIKYSWDGSNVRGYDNNAEITTNLWSSFGLIVGLDYLHNTSTKTLPPGQYSKIMLNVKGILSPDVVLRFEGPDSNYMTNPPNGAYELFYDSGTGSSQTLTSDWKEVSFNISSSTGITTISRFLGITMKTVPPQSSYLRNPATAGGVAYIDNIRFVK